MQPDCPTALGEELLAYITVGEEAEALLADFYMTKLRWGQGAITELVTIQAPVATPNLHWTISPPPTPCWQQTDPHQLLACPSSLPGESCL